MNAEVIKIKADDELFIPKFSSEHAAGADLRANTKVAIVPLGEPSGYIQNNIANNIIIYPGGRCLIDCGFSMEIPEGYHANILPRSGFANKEFACIPNSPGLIDSDYRGRVMVGIHNLGIKPIHIEYGDRIAQIVIMQHPKVVYVASEELSDTDRGVGGFGSSGKK